MGVEYKHYVYPVPGTPRPTAAQVAAVVDALVTGGWVPTTGAKIEKNDRAKAARSLSEKVIAKHDALSIRWSIEGPEQSGVRYPLTIMPSESDVYEEEIYYTVIVAWHPYFDVIHGENVDTPLDVHCECGAALGNKDYSIRAVCTKCKRPFDPTRQRTRIEDFNTGAKRTTAGAYFQFALAVDCGKCLPAHEDRSIEIRPELMQVCEQLLGVRCEQVGYRY